MPAVRLETLEKAVLYKLYVFSERNFGEANAIQLMLEFGGFSVSQNKVEICLSNLENNGLATASYSMMRDTGYSVSGSGIRMIEDELSSKGSFFSNYAELGDTWLFEAGGTAPSGEQQSQEISVPASERAVSINHNSPEFTEMNKVLKEALDTIKGVNSWNGDDREEAKSHLEMGLQLLRQPKVYLLAVSALILTPLYAAYNAIAQDAAKSLFIHIIHLVKAFFGVA